MEFVNMGFCKKKERKLGIDSWSFLMKYLMMIIII